MPLLTLTSGWASDGPSSIALPILHLPLRCDVMRKEAGNLNLNLIPAMDNHEGGRGGVTQGLLSIYQLLSVIAWRMFPGRL